jgi:predicted amidophosphoribosyltransferase
VIDFIRAWLFPAACVGCDAPGRALCASCAPASSDAINFSVCGVPAFALGLYDGPLRRAIVAMKHGERDTLETFAGLLACAPLPLTDTLVPVPTTRRRAAARGFDQAVVLARRLARLRGVACAEMLVKRGRAQEGRSRAERLAAAGRFRLRPSTGARPTAVMLLDDVCTTGATLADAMQTLGAADVTVAGIVVVARSDGTHPM